MLVLSRKQNGARASRSDGQPDIIIQVNAIRSYCVSLVISAPQGVKIIRAELLDGRVALTLRRL